MNNQEIEKYRDFMFNPDNELNCSDCPENRGETWPEFIKPCGQQNCWVTCHCRREEEA